ncbi:hypothetical protein [Geobacter sp. DSM 9736]|uniref:hypothetical protein n=1 Tax=Geobacter sp. DSM 9736 TaxID=1277350 RepID=UPI000B600EE3|nr:hypothetical protein [Geobacter sp. DSM 9736]SNB45173.1 hypothetical protein SAMN06269301_0576 [Geobacter sp. DSM 9736]
MHLLFKIVAVIFVLFVLMFIAIVIEESFLGGRRRRKLERRARELNRQEQSPESP